MQYFRPEGQSYFAGDCMPFFHNGTFHLYYLLDENHHTAMEGLGGHQWAHVSSTDLTRWTQNPLAIGITNDWEGSICTGSTFFHDDLFYAFYATRRRDQTQHLSLATSQDAAHFQKIEPRLVAPPEGYSPYHYRDPFVFQDETGLFHALVTASLDDYPLQDFSGYLAHLVSTDLNRWELKPPFIIPGLPGQPECPDYFFWNGWYYLIFSNRGVTYYRMSREPCSSWLRPQADVLDSPAAQVMKTAAFEGNRRIGAAWIGTREGNRDAGRFQFGGHIVFREIIQHSDGTLGTKFPVEMIPPSGPALSCAPTAVTGHITAESNSVKLDAEEGLEVAMLSGVPNAAQLTVRITPDASSAQFGLLLRGQPNFQNGYGLRFLPYERRIELFDQALTCVDGLHCSFDLDVVLKDDIIDVCIDQRRCHQPLS
jgi:beta-fructofuranosidase